MPYGTIELPRDMIAAATAYAKRERKSVPDLFADLLRRRYGYTMTVSVVNSKGQKRHVPIPDEVNAITGLVALPADVPDRELIRDAVLEKHGALE